MTYFSDTHTAYPIHRNLPSLTQMLSIRKQRRQLRKMDARALSDIGLTRTEAVEESRRPMWDVPAHWLR